MHAYVISGGNSQARDRATERLFDEWHVSPIDQHIVDMDLPSIGIDDVRAAQASITLKPFSSPYAVLVFKACERLTIVAQQALLKTIEEPPPHARIILSTASDSVLLPTILSRCICMYMPESFPDPQQSSGELQTFLTDIARLSYGQKVSMAETIGASPETTSAWIAQKITEGETYLQTLSAAVHPTSAQSYTLMHVAQFIRTLVDAQKKLDHNVHPKLVIDAVLFSVHKVT